MELLHQLGEMMLEDPHNCFLVLLQYTGERQQSILRSKFRSEWELFRYFVSYMHEIDNFRNESTTSCKGKDKAFEMIFITFCSILKSRTIYKEVVHGKPPRSARPFLPFNKSTPSLVTDLIFLAPALHYYCLVGPDLAMHSTFCIYISIKIEYKE